MLRVQIRLYFWPRLTLKPIIQGTPFSDIAHSDKWRVVAEWSESSAHIVWEADRKPYAASLNPSLLLTSVDLETHNSRSSIFGNNDSWRVVATRSEMSGHIVWRANWKPWAGGLNPSSLSTPVDLETYYQGHPFSEKKYKWRVVAWRSEISAHIVSGANWKPYAASSDMSLLLTSIDLETYISRYSGLGHFALWKMACCGLTVRRRCPCCMGSIGANMRLYAASLT